MRMPPARFHKKIPYAYIRTEGLQMLALPIFTASRPATIVGADELNFCVRDGNRWTLIAINTNYLLLSSSEPIGSVNFFIIPRFSLLSSAFFALLKRAGDPYRIRTDVNGVRGHCLNHLTNGPRTLYKSARALYTWSAFGDSNPGPTGYEPAALTN